MFFAIIDDITFMQQPKRKKITEGDEVDLNPPLTTESLKSERPNNKDNNG